MKKLTMLAAVAAIGFCSTAQAQPGPDPRGDATVSRTDEEAKAAERFAALDTNHDGSIAADEMAAGAQGQRESGGGMRRADADGDGKISKDEFVSAQLRRFDAEDANKDGQVTKAERDEARAQRLQGGWGGSPPGS